MRAALLLTLAGCQLVFELEEAPRCVEPLDTYAALPGLDDGHLYRTELSDRRTWQSAQSLCELEHAHLAVPDSLSERDALATALGDGTGWIGAARNLGDPPDVYHFVTGELVPLGLWRSGEPDNFEAKEFAAQLVPGEGLVDKPPEEPKTFQCECDGATALVTFDF